ncbi:hypothetical protein EON64_00090 [archaeon]|nr:MAG: hypothetical protein EON64_00090 [archaeon]
MEALEKLLEDLNRAVETEDAAVNVASLVASVEAIGSGDLDELDLDTCTALLLAPGQTASGLPGDSIKRSSSSLMQFLTASLRMKDRDIVRAKVHAVKFLAVYVKKQIKYVMIYAEKLAIDLIQLFKMEDSSEVKAALLLPVKNILRPRIYSVEAIDAVAKLDDADDEVDDYDDCVPFDLDTFPLQSIYQVLVEEVRLNKKLTKGVHREALATLGILVAVYPAAAFTVSVIDIILSLCDEALKNAFNSRGKDPDFPAIAGAFSCLDKCLYHFEARYVNSTELWKYLLQAAQSSAQEDTSRFSAAGKAIKLIRNHAQLFVNVIGELVHSTLYA